MREWPERVLRWAGPAIRRRSTPVLVVAVLLSLIGLWSTLQLRVSGDIAALVPESSPSVRALREVERLYGSPNTLIIVVRARNDEVAREVLSALAEQLEAHPLVERVEYRMDVDFFRDHALYFLDVEQLERLVQRLREWTADLRGGGASDPQRFEAARVALARRLVRMQNALEREAGDLSEFSSAPVSVADPRLAPGNRNDVVYAMTVHPRAASADVEETDRFVDEVSALLDHSALVAQHPGTRLVLGGATMGQTYQSRTLLADVKLISIVGAVGVALWILLAYRRPTALVLVTFPLLVALSWVFGFARLALGQLNVITASTFVVLFGIGIDFGLHIFSRHRELELQGIDFDAALDRSVVQTGRATATAATTTAMAFCALLLCTYRGFSELGLIISVGVALSFVSALFLFPAAATAANKLHLLRLGKGRPVVDDVMRGRAQAPRAWLVALSVGLAVTAVSAVAVTRLSFQWDYGSLAYRPPALDEAEEYQRAIFGTHTLPAVVAAETPERLRLVVAELRRRAAERGDRSTIDRVLSLDDLVPPDQARKHELMEELAALADDEVVEALPAEAGAVLVEARRLAQAGPFDVEDLPASVRQRFRGRSTGAFAVVFPSVELSDISAALRFRDEIADVRVGDRTYSAANAAIVMAEMVTLMFADARWVFALSLAIVTLIVIIDFRRVGDAVLVMTPLLLGLLWMLGAMTILGLPIDFYNVVALPAVIGLGVDNGVFIVHRYREEGPGSLRRIVRHTGRTIAVTTGATVLGMSSLVLGRHPGLRSIGLASAIGLVATFLAAVLLLPALLYVIERIRAAVLVRRKDRPLLFTVTYDPWTRLLKRHLESRGRKDLATVDVDTLPPPERLFALEKVKDLAGTYELPVLVLGSIALRGGGPDWAAEVDELLGGAKKGDDAGSG